MVRAHLAGRWATCPFTAVADEVVAKAPVGPILEVGCGHGLFATYLASQEPGRVVQGIDIDAGRIAVAARVAERAASEVGAQLSFSTESSGQVPAGPWAAVVLIDVVYLVDPAQQRALIAECAEVLAPGGALVVKETATSGWRARLTRTQELVAVRLVRLTAGERPCFVPPGQLAAWMVDAGLDVSQRSLAAGYLHPHHLVVGCRP